jgi:hypothetical protein
MEKPWKKGRQEMTRTLLDQNPIGFGFTVKTLPTVIGGLLVWFGCLMLMI